MTSCSAASALLQSSGLSVLGPVGVSTVDAGIQDPERALAAGRRQGPQRRPPFRTISPHTFALCKDLEHLFGRAYRGSVDDERAAVRREVIAELVELARKHSAQHAELYQTALESGHQEMADRAYANQTSWMEVARVLRMEIEQP
jgi:hypothetical protein